MRKLVWLGREAQGCRNQNPRLVPLVKTKIIYHGGRLGNNLCPPSMVVERNKLLATGDYFFQMVPISISRLTEAIILFYEGRERESQQVETSILCFKWWSVTK